MTYLKSRGLGLTLCTLLAVMAILNIFDRFCGLLPERSADLPNLVALIRIIGNMAGLISAALTLIAAIYAVIWTRRILSNLSVLNVSGLKTKDWHIYGFLVPLLNLFLSVFIFQELWKASDPDKLDASWKESAASIDIYVWWLCWIGAALSGVAEYYGWMAPFVSACVSTVLDLTAVVLAFGFVGKLSARQDQKHERLLIQQKSL